jgi:hypothetical protein
VLPRVNQGLPNSSVQRQCAQHRGRFHEVRARADYVKNVHGTDQGTEDSIPF